MGSELVQKLNLLFKTHRVVVAAALIACMTAIGAAGVRNAPVGPQSAAVRLNAKPRALSSDSDALPMDAGAFPAARPVYPYSIIPGGVVSVDELKSAIAADPVVASHYKSFDLKKTHIALVKKQKTVHVSYRVGDKVYWTSKKLVLRAGETILTDGVHSARTRCGNLIAIAPMKPVFAREPARAVLETPEAPELAFSPVTFPEVLPYAAPVAPFVARAAGPGKVAFDPIYNGGRSPVIPSRFNSTPPVIPISPTPEPSTLVLLGSGIACSWWMLRRFK